MIEVNQLTEDPGKCYGRYLASFTVKNSELAAPGRGADSKCLTKFSLWSCQRQSRKTMEKYTLLQAESTCVVGQPQFWPLKAFTDPRSPPQSEQKGAVAKQTPLVATEARAHVMY